MNEASAERSYRGRLAAITGAGCGMGRELARLLAAEGCHLALCDIQREPLEHSREAALAAARAAGHEIGVSTARCDVTREDDLVAFRDAALSELGRDSVDLLFNNAGIGGGGSLVADDRDEWERTFDVCWRGVYLGTRVFLPALMRSENGHLVNVSSVNGFWASLGPHTPHTAYSAAKFAVRGFSEALLTDLRLHAPHVRVSVVMPGHIGTEIAFNTGRVLGHSEPLEMDAAQVARARHRLELQDGAAAALSDDEVRQATHQRATEFRDQAPLDAEKAARIILDGVRAGRWRILVGDDAVALDRLVRAQPEAVYDPAFVEALQQQGHFEVAAGGDGVHGDEPQGDEG